MRIIVNAQTVVPGQMEGLGWYSYETLKRIIAWHPEHHFTLVFGKGIHPEFRNFKNVACVNIGPPIFRPLTWWLKFEVLLPFYIKKRQFDVYLSTDGWSSTRIKIPKVVVIHDINFEHYPEFSPWGIRLYYRHFFNKWAQSAVRLATVSEYSKSDIANTYNIAPQKIEVTLNGASSNYKPLTMAEQDEYRTKLTGGAPYFVFIGSLHPRKNVKNLLKAFDVFKHAGHAEKLVIVGEKFYWDKDTNETFRNMSYQSEVVFTGRLNQYELARVLGSSLALVYVSLFEGFGIPLVEAMNCHVPIITSNTTSMPEIAGNSALIVDPLNVSDIAAAMQSITHDKTLRQQLIEAGKQRKTLFSWDNTAQSLWKTVEQAMYQ